MKCVLPDEEIQRSTSSEANELLVGYHLFQTAIFFGTSARSDFFGDAKAAESGDFSKALFVVPGADFALAWPRALSWLETSEAKWVYEHPDDAASFILEKVGSGQIKISLSWKPGDSIEVEEDSLREVSIEVVDELVLKLVQHLPNSPAEDVAECLEELEKLYAEPE